MIMLFVDAIANKLTTLWANREVFFDEVPQNIDGNFAIKVVAATHTKGLDRRRLKSFTFDITYYLKSHDNKEYFSWAELLFYEFELLSVEGNSYHCVNMEANVVDRIGHFIFDINVNAVLEKELEDLMQELNIEVVLDG